jgi:hypothetical protein
MPMIGDEALRNIHRALAARYNRPNLDFYDPDIESQWRGGPPGGTRRFWVEKTLVTGRPDRETGPHSLGHALWSPQESSTQRLSGGFAGGSPCVNFP